MLRSLRARGAGTNVRVAGVGLLSLAIFSLTVVALGTIGCAGAKPVRAIRAARYYSAGTRALDRGRARDAIQALEQAAELMPSASEIQNHLGLAYWADGRSNEALRALELAVELDCENQAAQVNLARLRAGMGAANREAAIDGEGRSEPQRREAVDGGSVHGG